MATGRWNLLDCCSRPSELDQEAASCKELVVTAASSATGPATVEGEEQDSHGQSSLGNDPDDIGGVSISVLPGAELLHGPSDELPVLVSINTPRGQERTPTDICCVLDISGSMGMQAYLPGPEGHKPSGLLLLDVAKHAIRTAANMLTEKERLAIVVFNHEAATLLPLTHMDAEGRKLVDERLSDLAHGGRTNLWSGLHLGLEALRSSVRPPRGLAHVMLLTDGDSEDRDTILPNVARYKEQHEQLLGTVSTFGFGYGINSRLLVNLAYMGDGTYSFIPDPGFVGTAFVNALCNLLVTFAHDVRLSLQPEGGAEIKQVLGNHRVEPRSWGLEVNIASLQYAQPKHLVLIMSTRSDQSYLTVSAQYQGDRGKSVRVDAVEGQLASDPMEVSVQICRCGFVDTIVTCLGTAGLSSTRSPVLSICNNRSAYASTSGSSGVAGQKTDGTVATRSAYASTSGSSGVAGQKTDGTVATRCSSTASTGSQVVPARIRSPYSGVAAAQSRKLCKFQQAAARRIFGRAAAAPLRQCRSRSPTPDGGAAYFRATTPDGRRMRTPTPCSSAMTPDSSMGRRAATPRSLLTPGTPTFFSSATTPDSLGRRPATPRTSTPRGAGTLSSMWMQQLDEIAAMLEPALEAMLDFEHTVKMSPAANTEPVLSLLEDVAGQATLALSDPSAYLQWGQHYLPSLMFAHQAEQCNNFKDAGVQKYGGELFCKLRSQAEEIFESLVPLRAGDVPMAAFHDRDAGCIHGDSLVRLASGEDVRMADLARGHLVLGPTGETAEVLCTVRSKCHGGRAQLVQLPGGTRLTPYHPILRNGKWVFPAHVAEVQEMQCEAVYSVILQGAAAFLVGGVACVALGHGIQEGAARHPYYSSPKAAEDIFLLPGALATGRVELEASAVLRDPTTGLVCGLRRRG